MSFLKAATKVVPPYDIPTLSLLYKLNKLSPAAPGAKLPLTLFGPKTMPRDSKVLNDRVGLFRGDITTLAVDAIVNAANRTLLGGGGVDGAIHRAAGDGLYKECLTLHGCQTGSAKITGAYRLPCKHVIHAVGPVYDVLDPSLSESLLNECYVKSLELAVEHGCKTIAFSAISTGVYGYPNEEAAPVAISAVRKFLEQDSKGKIEKVVFVTFEQKVVDAYNEFLPLYFPPVTDGGSAGQSISLAEKSKQEQEEKEEEAEAEAVAAELPAAPTADPSDPEHVDKKQKQKQDNA